MIKPWIGAVCDILTEYEKVTVDHLDLTTVSYILNCTEI